MEEITLRPLFLLLPAIILPTAQEQEVEWEITGGDSDWNSGQVLAAGGGTGSSDVGTTTHTGGVGEPMAEAEELRDQAEMVEMEAED